MNQSSTAFHHNLRRTSRLVLSDYPVQLTARSFALSTKGGHQPVNQDSHLAVDHFPIRHESPVLFAHPDRPLPVSGDSLFVVADGRGAAQDGSRASSLAIEVIEEFLRYIWGHFQRRHQIASRRQILNGLRVAFDRADQFIWDEAQDAARNHAMGAAITAACTYRGDLFLAYAGDTQAFLWRAGKLHRLTRPTGSSQQHRRPKLTHTHDLDQPANADPETPIVGGRRAGVHVRLRMLDLKPNDYLLLCTQGLMEHATEHLVNSTISVTPDPQRICESLIAEAEKFTDHEDATVVVARFALAHD